jgi:hypothetical protein
VTDQRSAALNLCFDLSRWIMSLVWGAIHARRRTPACAAEVFWMMFKSALLTSTTTFARAEPDDANAVSQTAPNSKKIQRPNVAQPQYGIN